MSKKRYLLLFCLSLSCLFVMAQQKSAHQHMGGDKGKEDCSADALSGSRETECRCYRLPWW